MEFFDVNVPYHEKDTIATTTAAADKDNAAKKAARLKVAVKAMELGYTGVAYDRLLKGVMSDKDRCTIPPFPLSSLLKAAPALADSVKFHRQLLGVPVSATFRQYRRITVVVDSVVGASVLNSGNPVLKSYDLVAVRPMNQVAFDQACKVAEVDLIAIDFSQKLPFRLKFPMVKAAIERGIYFEITYSQLISGTHLRREMLPNAKMLVNWTRGKNLIMSSAARTANEVRGPYDVANLSSLLGLSIERAKAAVSRNCRSLLASALRKKQYHKEAIRVESISSSELKTSAGLLSSWNNWDPISSGEGDLPSLDDFGKLFSNATNVPQNVPKRYFSTECVSIPEDKPLESQNCNQKNSSSQNIQTSFSRDVGDLKLVFSTSNDKCGLSLAAEVVLFPARPSTYNEGDLLSLSKPTTFVSSAVKPDAVVTGQDHLMVSRAGDLACGVDPQPTDSSSEDIITKSTIRSGFPDVNECEPSLHPKRPTILHEEAFVPDLTETKVDGGSSILHTCNDENGDKDHLVQSSSMEALHGSSMDVDSPCISDEDAKISTENDIDSKSRGMLEEQAIALPKVLEQENFTSHACSASVQECYAETSPSEQQNDATPVANLMLVKKNIDEVELQKQGNLVPVTTDMQMEGLVDAEGQVQECHASASLPDVKHKSGKNSFIQKRKHQIFPFPSKGFLKPFLFKKKVQRLKGSRKHHASIYGGNRL